MTKIISISDDAYQRLSRIKNGLSFSEVIIKITSGSSSKSLLDVVKSWEKDEELSKCIESAYKKRAGQKLKRAVF